MIPVRLECRNFLPYRAPDPVRFEGIHLACLTGPNGAGKSSLLDAITWALWGKARARRDDDLIHLGQTDMHVQLDFEQEGSIYRVLRQRSRGKRSQGKLELFIFKEDGTPTTITEPSMRATQHKIDELLRLDYETFVHSAFLQQGKADAFTTKNPAERKKILSDILGLEQWARYEDSVKARQNEIKQNVAVFEQRIQEIDTELARKPQLEAELAAAQEEHKSAEALLKTAQQRMEELKSTPAELRGAQENKANAARRLADYQRDLKDVEETITRQQQTISEYQTVLESREEIEQGYAALKTARDTSKALSDKLKQLSTLKDERHGLTKQLDEARNRLTGEIKVVQSRIAELEKSVDVDYQEELTDVQKEVADLRAQETERNRLHDLMSTLREERGGLEVQRETMTTEGKALNDRLQRLEAADAAEALCPLCGQPLDPEQRQQLLEQLQEEVEAKREDYRQTMERIAAIAETLIDQKKAVDNIDLELKRLSPLVERVGWLQNQVQAAQDASIRVKAERERLDELEKELQEEQFAPDVRQQLAALDERQSALGYDEASHDSASEQLAAHEQYEQLYSRLTVAQESLEGAQRILDDSQKRCERLQAAIRDIQGETERLDAEIARLTELEKEFHRREDEVAKQRTHERSVHDRVLTAEQSLNALKAQAEQKARYEQRLKDARHREAIYGELRQAFGKNGIPAMVIETAIPELETTANNLLARMTDGRMHLRLTTQREKVTGGTAETLAIEIADELGTRDYDLYSGGEAFRINFAIRVALSQMLARRAGAHLRTLFIDEGFGTQDAIGRNKLIEAINAIQDEFELVLVITHIDELRDSFPVHIVVDKTVNGSRIALQ